RSMYFRDPNGITLEFACWTRALDERDIQHAPHSTREPVS
ncbi:MAG: VOC family protein, partial [Actinobacteria bacterium]|nr:VOC family protein [Actinomycetota bacterium]